MKYLVVFKAQLWEKTTAYSIVDAKTLKTIPPEIIESVIEIKEAGNARDQGHLESLID